MADEMALQENADVEFDLNDGVIVVRLSHAAKPSLEDLIAQITPENVHGEVDWGKPVGYGIDQAQAAPFSNHERQFRL